MDAYQERVLVEARELNDRLNRLMAFLDSDNCLLLADIDQSLLKRQARAMGEYAEILAERIGRF
jgi:tRNA isopentenyl-2-thiomethyl-A-37 hydroxylase MiaE